jgi:hypothetical protein
MAVNDYCVPSPIRSVYPVRTGAPSCKLVPDATKSAPLADMAGALGDAVSQAGDADNPGEALRELRLAGLSFLCRAEADPNPRGQT